MTKRNFYILLALSTVTLLSGLHNLFIGMGRINPFLFYDYYNSVGVKGINISAFVYELGYMIQVLVVLFLCIFISNSKSTKNIIQPFIWIALIDILDYIAFYKQLSYVKLPLLVLLVLIYNIKWKKLKVK